MSEKPHPGHLGGGFSFRRVEKVAGTKSTVSHFCMDKRHTLEYHLHMIFHWNEEKNSLLKNTRGISFERIVVAIEEGHLIDVLEQPNKEAYPNQLVIVVDIDGYACCVPCVDEPDGNFFLKTLYMSRKFTKLYNLGGVANE